jgi:hypothetical protein
MVSKEILMKMQLIMMIISGNKFVIKQVRGVRKQFIMLNGQAILGFVRNGKKFADYDSYTEVTTKVDCKVGRFGEFRGIFIMYFLGCVWAY